jgi:anti-sigma28 factor (negative regulator of flagellin synthesis)
MKINGVTQIPEAQRVKAGEATVADGTPKTTDRVTVGAAKEVEAAIGAARQSVGGARAARLDRLEAQVRSGGYQPDASRVAEQILSDAEVEARIQAMLNH